jgi:hypothetical protein
MTQPMVQERFTGTAGRVGRALIAVGAGLVLTIPLAGSAPSTPASAGVAGAAVDSSSHLDMAASFTERRNKNGGWDRTSVQPSFQVVQALLSRANPIDVLLVQRLETTAHSDAEGTDSTLEVSGWTAGTKRYDKKLWSFTNHDDEGRLARTWNLYESIKYGCCGGEDVHDYYSLKTGKLAGTASSDHLAAALLAIPNTVAWRFVAFQSGNAQRQLSSLSAIPDFLGVLTLGSDEGVRRRIAISAKGVEAWTPTLSLRLAGKQEDSTNLDLFSADGNPAPAGFSGCVVRLVFEDTKELIVPITADDFDLTHATLPRGYKAQRVGATTR